MMVVMQLLAADEDAPGDDVGAGVPGRKVAVAPEMADAVDHPGRPERDPGDLRKVDKRNGHDTEQSDVGHSHQRQSKFHLLRVDMTLEPVVRGAVTVTLDGRPVA